MGCLTHAAAATRPTGRACARDRPCLRMPVHADSAGKSLLGVVNGRMVRGGA